MQNQPMAAKPMGMAAGKKKGNPFFGVMPMAIMALSIVTFLLLIFIAVTQ